MNPPSPGNCLICGGTQLHERPFGYRFNGRWLQAWECRTCSVIFIHPQPSKEELAKLYSKEYFDGDFRCGHEGTYFDEKTLDRLSNSELLGLIRQYKPSGKFFELGCAGGAFLNTVRQQGYEVTGVEFSEEAGRFARERFGLKVITGDLHSAKFADGTFDVLYLGDVLEHLPDPQSTAAELHRVAADGGLLVLDCPMQTNTLFSRVGFLAYDAVGRRATVQLPPYHLFEYRPRSLEYLLRTTGFSVVRKKEGMIPPADVHLRGSPLERIGKKLFQYPNYLLTRLTGVFGDRIRVIAEKT